MQTRFDNWSSFYQKISLVFNGIIALSLLPFAWVYLELEQFRRQTYFEGTSLLVFEVLSTLLIAVLIYWGYSKFNSDLKKIDSEDSLSVKLGRYYKISVARYAIYEMAAIICLSLTYFAQELFFAVLYAFILFMFSLARPKYDNVVLHLRLSDEEKQLLTKDKELD